jgi:PAS domain S-box-containing protein/TyrR family helix-turn-helix protein
MPVHDITGESLVINDVSNNSNIFLRMQALLDAICNGIIIIDTDRKVLIYNQSAEKMLGIPKNSVLNRDYTEVFPNGRLHRVLTSKQGSSNVKFVNNNKTYLSMNRPIVVEDNVIGAVALIQDISELEHVSLELEYTKKLKSEMDAIIEASFDSIFVTDAKGNVLSLNDAYTRITGIKAEDLIGKNMYDLVEQGLYDRSATIMVIETKKSATFVQNIKNGTTLLVTGNPIFDENGELVRVLTNGRDITELNRLKQEVEQAYNLSKHYEEELKRMRRNSGGMVVYSEKSREILDLAMRIGKVDSTVIIYGESGVGKELVAQELHKNSSRSNKPLISINCAAIPEDLLESELFGYESGAFSGAKKAGKMGIFELANGGILFLDEIGELPINLQSKLLRVIQEREILRIGGTKPIGIDVRIIAATNRNLPEMIRKGQFRQDLYYRLNVVPIYVPPLRERKEEIPLLAYYFLQVFNEKYNMQKTLDERVTSILVDYDWPGNIRELRNVIERAVVTSTDTVISSVALRGSVNQTKPENEADKQDTPVMDLKEKVQAYEKNLIQQYAKIFTSSRKLAKALGVSQTTIVRKAALYGINLEVK